MVARSPISSVLIGTQDDLRDLRTHGINPQREPVEAINHQMVNVLSRSTGHCPELAEMCSDRELRLIERKLIDQLGKTDHHMEARGLKNNLDRIQTVMAQRGVKVIEFNHAA